MSNRSLYPPGVVVTGDHLSYTESTKASEDNERLLASQGHTSPVQGGIVSGFDVTLNGGAPTTLDVAIGDGYTPSGHHVKTTAGSVALPLSDLTTGLANKVFVAYTETTSNPSAHEYDGTTPYTRATGVASVVVLTQAEYNALPETDTTNMSGYAQDRLLYIARATYNGSSVDLEIPLNTPASANTLTVDYASTVAPGINPVFAYAQPSGQATIQVVISAPLPNGTATVAFNSAESGDSLGATVIATTGTHLLTSTNGYLLLVDVVEEMLTRTTGTYNYTLNVSPFLESEVGDILTPRDLLHRQSIAAGSAVRAKNPHGMSASDLGAAFIRAKQLLVADSTNTDAAANLPLIITNEVASRRGSVQYRSIFEAPVQTGSRAGFRLYIGDANGDRDGVFFTVNARYDNTSGGWTPDTNSDPAYLWALGVEVAGSGGSQQAAVQVYEQTDTTAAWLDSDWVRTFASGIPEAVMQVGSLVAGSGASTKPRLQVQAPLDLAGFDRAFIAEFVAGVAQARLYSVYTTSTSDYFEIVLNASWDGSVWAADSTARNCVMMRFYAASTSNSVRIYSHSGTGTWSDAGWTQTLALDTAGNLDLTGALTSTTVTATNVAFTSAKTFRKVIPGAWGVITSASPNVSRSITNNGAAVMTATTTQSMLFNLDLPHGATLTTINAHFYNYDFSAGAGAQMYVSKMPFGSATSSVATSSASAAVSAGYGTPLTITSIGHVVDNNSEALYAYVQIGAGGSNAGALHVIEVVYTLPSASW